MTAAIAGAVLAAMAGALWWGRPRGRLAVGFAAGQRRLGPAEVGAGLYATGAGATSTLLMMGFVAGGRIDLLLAEAGAVAGLLAAALWVAPRVQASGAISLPALVAERVGRRWGPLVAVATAVVEVGWIATVALAAGAVGQHLWGQPQVVFLGLMGFAAAGAAVGGLRGVGAAQGVAVAVLGVALAATVAGVWQAQASAIGLKQWGPWWDRAPAPGMGWGLAGIFFLRELLGGAQWQRYLGARSAGAARGGAWIALMLRLALGGMVALLGLAGTRLLGRRQLELNRALIDLGEALGGVPAALLGVAAAALLLATAMGLMHALMVYLERHLLPGRDATLLGPGRRGGTGAAVAVLAAVVTSTYLGWQAVWTTWVEVYLGAMAPLLVSLLAGRALSGPAAWLGVLVGVAGGAGYGVAQLLGAAPGLPPTVVVALAAALAGTATGWGWIRMRGGSSGPSPSPDA